MSTIDHIHHRVVTLQYTTNTVPFQNLLYISKLVERVVAHRFTRHVSVHNLFPPQQSAYRPFHSTVDEKHVSLLLLLDLSAAFDTVDLLLLLLLLSAVTHAPFHASVRRPTSWPNARDRRDGEVN